MITIEEKPRLLLVPDEDFLYGIQHGAYPEFEEELKTGEIVVISRDVAYSEYGVSSPKENVIYVRNIFDDTYRDITAEAAEKSMIEAKAVAIREVLVMLGVRSARLEHSVKHIEDGDTKSGGKVRKGTVSVSVDVHANKHHEVDVEAIIKLDPFERPAKNAEEVRKYAVAHGLDNESTIIAWIARLERDHKLEGPESIEVTFLEELTAARDVALNLNIVQCDIGFSINSLKKETHKFTEKIVVDFGGGQ